MLNSCGIRSFIPNFSLYIPLSAQAEGLIAGYAGEHVLADQGYDAQEFRQHILELGWTWV